MLKTAPPEYVRIKAQLRQRVNQQWPVGTRLPPIRDLARQMGMGQCNTLRAVRELAAEGVLESRQRKGTFVADPNIASPQSLPKRSLVAGRKIAIVSYDAYSEPFIYQMQDAVERTLQPLGAVTRSVVYGRQSLGELGELDADAVVLLNYSPVEARWRNNQVMLSITTSADAWARMPGGYDIVSVDHEQGAFVAGRYLVDAGLDDDAWFFGGAGHVGSFDATSAARLVGFQRGLGRMLEASRHICSKYYDPVQAACVTGKLISSGWRPRAVFASTDELAMGYIAGASAHGMEVGRDFHIIGFDGQRVGRELRGGPLTTIQVPASQMGEIGARLLIERLAKPDQPVRRVHLGCTLFEGTTVRPANGETS